MMMEKEWVRPQTIVQQFVPNEYVAGCGDSGTKYLFKCDSGEDMIKIFGGSFDGWGDVFLDDGTNLTPGIQSYYHPCGATHEASTSDTFMHGYFYLNGGNDKTKTDLLNIPYKKTEVIIWRGENGNNVHCTTNLDTENWQTTKS